MVSGRTKIIPSSDKKNLRCKYEVQWADSHRAEDLNKRPYEYFVTANFLCRRSVFGVCRFDERFTTYGFEDLAFGIALQKNAISIMHIANPVGLDKFETNERYMQKVEQSLRTLHRFRNDLRGYSQVQTVVEAFGRWNAAWLLRLWHRIFGSLIRRILVKHRPSLLLLSIYKVEYYASLA